jgi:hypothetical protein
MKIMTLIEKETVKRIADWAESENLIRQFSMEKNK